MHRFHHMPECHSAFPGLRCADTAAYAKPRTRTRFGERGFRYAGLVACNSLPSHLHSIKAKFHYGIWSQTGPRLVADLLAHASELADRPNSSSLQVCDQLRICLRPDSVMEFGFNWHHCSKRKLKTELFRQAAFDHWQFLSALLVDYV